MGERAHAIDPNFKTVTNAYDGQFYWGIAIDPLARGYIHQRFDNASYRYGHPLLGWLGWLVSGDGARRVPAALLAICLASMFAAGAASARLGQLLGLSGLAGAVRRAQPRPPVRRDPRPDRAAVGRADVHGADRVHEGAPHRRRRAVRAPHPLEGAVHPRSRRARSLGSLPYPARARERGDPRGQRAARGGVVDLCPPSTRPLVHERLGRRHAARRLATHTDRRRHMVVRAATTTSS